MRTTPNTPAVEIAVRTDPGRDPDKQINEDSALHKETPLGLLAVVCDGMGGHAGGKEASELAIATIVEIIEAAPPATTAAVALERAIEEANARIWSMPTAEAGFRPGSTVVAVLAHEDGVEVAHVGDSRLYLVHAGAISQVTRDHSMVQEMVDRNLLRAEDAAHHPDANKILRALGIAKEVEVDLRSEPLSYVAGDVLVLSSDGLSDLVEPAEILQIAGTQPPAQAVGQLVDLANARGGHDNITAMVLRMKSSARARDAPTLMKTIPLTAHAAPEHGGPTGTVVSSPLEPGAAVAGAPAQHTVASSGAPRALAAHRHDSGPSAAVTPASERSPDRGSRAPVIALGIALAVAAMAILGAILYVATRPAHRAVPVVVDEPREASVAALDDDDDDRPALEIAPAPTLDPEPPPRRLGPSRDAGDVDPCAALRRARRRDASADALTRLDERCRAQGGTP